MATNPTNPRHPDFKTQITNREKWSLEAKAKQGWKCYFIEREHIYHLQEQRNQLREQVNQLKAGGKVEYDHLKQMFLQLYDKVGELCDCPVCMETMNKENTSVPICGHLVCKTCKDKMTECPICRKTY